MTELLERRAVAVMFTDMFGYTAELEANESQALQKRARYIGALEAVHRSFGGTIVQRLGDGSMSMFPNAQVAVQAAVAMQQQLGAGVPVRIGIHFGEVIIEPERLSGMPVNIAARIESFAVPGSVIVSDAVTNQIDSGEFKVVWLGQFKFKNVGHPAELYAISFENLVVPQPNDLQGKGERYFSLPRSLPDPKAPLIGREEELKKILDSLKDKRMITIIGPGGMGKSRLAIELGHMLEAEFLNGVAFVPLAQVNDLPGVIQALAEKLDVKEAEGRTLNDGILRLIGERKFLLLLDNIEQIREAGAYLSELLARCPELRVVSTSRTALQLEAEEEIPLSPLAVPESSTGLTVDSLADYPATAMLIQSASLKTKFDPTEKNVGAIVDICKRLDGLPLALELAAARLRVLSPAELLQRLDKSLDLLQTKRADAPVRQQTMRATIEWSHSMLAPDEQALFRQFSVFVDGCTLENLEALAKPEMSVLDQVDSLVEKALIFLDTKNRRLKMLNVIREFASEKLESSGEKEEVLARHTRLYSKLSRQIRDGIEGSKQLASIEMGIDEEANLMATLDRLLSAAQDGDKSACTEGLKMCGDLWLYWHIRGKNLTARKYTTSFLEIEKESVDTVERIGALATAGLASWTLGQFERANEEWGKAYVVATNLKAERELSILTTLCAIGLIGFDLPRALKLAAEGLQRSKALKSTWAEGFALGFDALVHLISGDAAAAKSKFAEALAIQEKLEDREFAGLSLGGLAAIAAKSGELPAAIEIYKKSLTAYQIIGDRAEEARILSEIAWVQIEQKKFDEARTHFLDAVQAYADIASVRGIGFSMIGLAATQAQKKNFTVAVQLAAAAEKYAHEEGMANIYSEESPGRSLIEEARSKLAANDLAKATEVGRGLTINEALQLARTPT